MKKMQQIRIILLGGRMDDRVILSERLDDNRVVAEWGRKQAELIKKSKKLKAKQSIQIQRSLKALFLHIKRTSVRINYIQIDGNVLYS